MNNIYYIIVFIIVFIIILLYFKYNNEQLISIKNVYAIDHFYKHTDPYYSNIRVYNKIP
jgi:hypothetical protein